MSQDGPAAELPTTSYALLGLLAFGDDLSGYELKQRADRTLRFYWVSPAMSQVYSELTRLAEAGLVEPSEAHRGGRRRTRRYRITDAGHQALREWLSTDIAEFPVLKHPVALRLLLGHLAEPATVRRMLRRYDEQLCAREAELRVVRESLHGRDAFRFPAMVADWGLHYYDTERVMVHRLLSRIGDGGEPAEGPPGAQAQ